MLEILYVISGFLFIVFVIFSFCLAYIVYKDEVVPYAYIDDDFKILSEFTNKDETGTTKDNKVYLNNRMLLLNGYDLRQIYLKIYDKEEEIVTDLKPLNYSMFEERSSVDKSTTSNYIKSLYWKS